MLWTVKLESMLHWPCLVWITECSHTDGSFPLPSWTHWTQQQTSYGPQDAGISLYMTFSPKQYVFSAFLVWYITFTNFRQKICTEKKSPAVFISVLVTSHPHFRNIIYIDICAKLAQKCSGFFLPLLGILFQSPDPPMGLSRLSTCL